MRALIQTGHGVELMERPSPPLTERHDVRIAIRCAAICRTDLYAAEGRLPVAPGRILGHEFAGVIESTREPLPHLRPGDRVVVDPFLPCGTCADCAALHPHLCAHGGFLGLTEDGAFAEEIAVPAAQVWLLPEGLSLECGAYAEPLAATLAVLHAGLERSDMIAVVGEGRIAALTLLVLRDHGFARACRVPPGAGEAGFDAVVEAGITSANSAAVLNLLRPGGTLVLKSRTPEPLVLHPMELIRQRLQLRAVHYAPFAEAMAYLPQCAAQLQPFMGRSWPLAEYQEAFRAAHTGEETKLFFAISP